MLALQVRFKKNMQRRQRRSRRQQGISPDRSAREREPDRFSPLASGRRNQVVPEKITQTAFKAVVRAASETVLRGAANECVGKTKQAALSVERVRTAILRLGQGRTNAKRRAIIAYNIHHYTCSDA